MPLKEEIAYAGGAALIELPAGDRRRQIERLAALSGQDQPKFG
jgi:hypothetical protein